MIVPLHPLVLFDPEANEFAFLNASRGKTRAEYLCYHPGRVVNRDDLGDDHRALLAKVLGTAVDDDQVGQWAAHSRAEDPPAPEEPAGPRRMGEFELLSELGRGGMGVVYRAWQPSLGRQIALKSLIRAGDPKAEARFNREIHALGRVEHPNLVKVFTSGSEADRWFYAMELVEGATLAAVCGQLSRGGADASQVDLEAWRSSLGSACREAREAETPLSDPGDAPPRPGRPVPSTPSPPAAGGRDYVRLVVDLVRQVADAAHALHEAGIIHRDIKPENVLVTPDGSQAVLMDLGLAQLADESEGRLTRTRQFVGTLRYASPEQVLSVPLDRRSDVYSLGATLWELLTLRPLFGANDQTPTPELMLKIQSADVGSPRRINPSVPQDLEAIVTRSLEKDRGRRYATAADLAADLGRWLRGEPVLAQPPSFQYVAGKYLRRHRLPLAAAGATILAGIASLVALGFLATARRIDQEKRKVESALASAVVARGEAVTAQQAEHRANEVVKGAKDVLNRRLVRKVDLGEAARLWDKGDLMASLPWVADALDLEKGDPERERMHRIRIATTLRQCPRLIRVFEGVDNDDPRFSPDGRYVLTEAGDVAWELASGRQIRLMTRTGKERFKGFSPDGRGVVQIVPGEGLARVRVLEIATGRTLVDIPLKHEGIRDARFSPDGRTIATTGDDDHVRIWDAGSGRPIAATSEAHPGARWIYFSPDSRRLCSHAAPEDDYAEFKDSLRVWDARTGRPVGPEIPLNADDPRRRARTVIFTEDGTRLEAVSVAGRRSIWDCASGKASLAEADRGFDFVEFSRDRNWYLGCSRSESVQIRATSSRKIIAEYKHEKLRSARLGPDERRVFLETEDSILIWDWRAERLVAPPFGEGWSDCEVSPDGRHVLQSPDSAVQVWDTIASESAAVRIGVEKPISVTFTPDGKRVLVCAKSIVGIWFAESGEPAIPSFGGTDYYGASLSADGSRVVTAGHDHIARVGEVATGRELLALKHDRIVLDAAFSPDGSEVATAAWDEIRSWDTATGQLRRVMKHGGHIIRLRYSPDGRLIAAASDDGKTTVWDPATGHRIAELAKSLDSAVQGSDRIWDVSFSHDGRRIVTTGSDFVVVWDVRSGGAICSTDYQPGNGPRAGSRFSPDDRWVAIAGGCWVQICDATTGKPLLTAPIEHHAGINRVSFSPDGRLLATASKDKTARVWEVATGLPVTPRLKHGGPVEDASFGPDGRRLATVSEDGTARIWDLSPDDRPVEDLIRLGQTMSESLVDRDGALDRQQPGTFGNTWRSLAARYPKDFADSSREAVIAWHRSQMEDCRSGKYYASQIWHLDRLLDLVHDERELFELRAEAHHNFGRWKEALADYTRAIELGATDPSMWINRGNVRSMLAEWELAIQDYSRAAELTTGTFDAWSDRGEAYAELGQWDKAIADFTRAVTGGESSEFSAWRGLALSSLAIGDLAQCRKAASDVLRRDGPNFLKLLGLLEPNNEFRDDYIAKSSELAWLNIIIPDGVPDLKLVVELSEALAEADPKDHELAQRLGAAKYRAGDFEEAIRWLNESIRLRPEGGHVFEWLFLAMAHHRLGHRADAVTFLDRARKWMTDSTQEKPADDSLGGRIPWTTWRELQALSCEADSLLSVKR